VIEWGPPASAAVLNVAMPADRLPVPRTVAPSLNVTVPVAVGALTVAMKITEAPKVDGLRLDVTAVVVAAGFTVWMMGAEVDAPKFAFPP
jgi:nitric oxide synthase oxygenase domain/subunit